MALDRSATFDFDSNSFLRNDAHCDYSKEDLGVCRVRSVLQHTQPSYIDLTVSDDCLPNNGTGGHHKYVPTSAFNYIDLGDASDCPPLLVCAEQTSSKSLTYVDITSNNSRSVPHLVLPKHLDVRHNLYTVRSDCSVSSSGPGAFYPDRETAEALRCTYVVTSLISESRGNPPLSRVVDGVPNCGDEQSSDMSQSSCEPATVAPLVDFCPTKATIGTACVDLTSDDWTSNYASITDQTSDNATCNHSASSSSLMQLMDPNGRALGGNFLYYAEQLCRGK
jgi:hypothetical protein